MNSEISKDVNFVDEDLNLLSNYTDNFTKIVEYVDKQAGYIFISTLNKIFVDLVLAHFCPPADRDHEIIGEPAQIR